MRPHRFLGRRYAGKLLATRLESLREANALVIALSPGGLIVADAIAIAIGGRLSRWTAPTPDVRARTVIAVDDGIVASESVRAVLATMRAMVPTHLVFATPIADRCALDEVRREADAVALQIEEGLTSVASRYQSYREITDEEARELIECARARSAADSTRKMRAVPSSMPPPS